MHVFKVEPDDERYGLVNINCVELNEILRFDDGWQPLLDVRREGVVHHYRRNTPHESPPRLRQKSARAAGECVIAMDVPPWSNPLIAPGQ